MASVEDLNVKVKPQWCPGCGNIGLLAALKGAISELGIKQHETVIVSGIGCSGKTSHYVNTYGFEGLHGRSLPVASAIKLANTDLTVIAEGGDGDGYGIGVQHFVHIMRRNYDLTYLVHDNQIYGLTTGQASPTTQLGMKTKTTPHGVIETPFNPIAYAILGGATYIARGFVGDIPHLKELIKGAIAHKGFALVDIFQPCVTFNKLNTYDFFRQRVYKLEDSGYKYGDKDAALSKAFEDSKSEYKKIPIGLFYKEERLTYEAQLPQLKGTPLAKQDLSKIDLSAAFTELE